MNDSALALLAPQLFTYLERPPIACLQTTRYLEHLAAHPSIFSKLSDLLSFTPMKPTRN